MEWIKLEEEEQLNSFIEASATKPLIIYKHSTRCSISSLTFDRLNRNIKSEMAEVANLCFLDILKYRSLSDKIADYFGVRHQSPQILLVKDGKGVYHDSHFGVDGDELQSQLKKVVGLN